MFFNRKSTAYAQDIAELKDRLKRAERDFEGYKSDIHRDVLEMADLHSKMRKLYLRLVRFEKIEQAASSGDPDVNGPEAEQVVRTPREIRDAISSKLL